MTAQTTATVSTMPWVRQIEVQRLSCADRISELRELARTREWMRPGWVTTLVAAYSHDSLTPQQREDAWAAVVRDVTLADAVEVGIFDWDWRCNSCGHPFARGCQCACCPSAIEHAHAVAGESLQRLAGGIR